jgi:hypothetical protein
MADDPGMSTREQHDPNPIFDEVVAAAARAVEALQARAGGRLDYSLGSLEAVDDMLVEVSGYVADLDEQVVTNLVQQLGCYVLEVGRRAYGGRYYWHDEGEQPVLVVGEPDAHVAMMAWSKVTGRITGDAGDEIPFFFAGFAQKAAQPAPGEEVLFV